MSEIGMNSGYDVKKTDSLGMAQRGGSVVSHVRWGKHVFSPMVKRGEADFLVGFEELEAARWAPYLRPGGVVIVADVVIMPISVIGSKTPYPGWKEIEKIVEQYTQQIYLIEAPRIAREVGNPRAMNMVILGFLSAFLELEQAAWTETIRRRLPTKFVESSLKAFVRGAEEAKAMIQAKGGVR
jgi:indolepyruvate ferredoxin oxidoreductase beta subunit